MELSPSYDRLVEGDREQKLALVLDIDEETLRGVELPTLLASGSRLFAGNGQAARDDPAGTYALSKPVTHLFYFISHSWRTSRLIKHAALCVHFNLKRAAIASAALNFVLFTYLTFNIGSLPPNTPKVTESPGLADGAPSRMAGWCELLAPTVFIVVLLFGHHLFDDGTFFLDICCISQEDEAQKQAGISSLGAILDRSERMLVLCDGEYFSRLWCLFELSAFSKRAGASRIDFVPLHVPLRIFGWAVCFVLFYYSMQSTFPLIVASGTLDAFDAATIALLFPFLTALWMSLGLPFVLVAELEACRIREACAALRSFRLPDAQCFSHDDRTAILTLISKWWSDGEVAAAAATAAASTGSGSANDARRRHQQEALGTHRFEQFVRQELAPQLAGVAGRDWTVGSLAAMYVTGAHGWILDMISGSRVSPHHLLVYLCWGALCWGFWLPVQFETIKWLAAVAWRQKQIGWPAPAYYALFGILSVLCLFLIFIVLYSAPVPNVLIDTTFRWPADSLSELGNQCLKFQVVLGLHMLAAGVVYASK